jgi:hypothetical protein|tara:strand:- start:362 stop:508 length:147 start_codon:yes stop_codon:yes gene_type:complete
MSRYIQEALEAKEETKDQEREMPKAGKYSIDDLQPEKTTIWSRGSMNG